MCICIANSPDELPDLEEWFPDQIKVVEWVVWIGCGLWLSLSSLFLRQWTHIPEHYMTKKRRMGDKFVRRNQAGYKANPSNPQLTI